MPIPRRVSTRLNPPIDPQEVDWVGRVVGLFGGCYCPPHSGHYYSVVNSIQKFNLTVVVVQVYGRRTPEEARHGVPESESILIWQDWGRKIFSKYGCLVIAHGWDNLSYISSDVQYVFDFTFAESDEERDQLQKKSPQFSSMFMHHVPRDHISRLVFVRGGDGLSATKFTHCLMDSDEKCIQYVPEDFSDQYRKDYINFLRKRYGKYLK